MTRISSQLLGAIAILGILCIWFGRLPSLAAEKAITGPETEKRFPPLSVPDGFKATLFACDPLVEYPSVISLGPERGSLFVAHDYVTGLGVEIIRRDEIRIVRDTNGDGYADRSTLYADGFNSIQGLAYHSGSVYVMHAPLLTRLTDKDGNRVADERRDLLQGLGLPPEENPNRLHCANGVVVGHDGWLYLALGDRGCDIRRPEGDRLVFREGGILRCRPDGSDLHVFSRGLRNIYDLAFDEELNVFVRDNENDGGDYMIRVCHCFHGSDHGYPYLYKERPAEAMPPLAELGRGSSAGGTGYLETAFPPVYRESLFFCEWGRGVVRYRLRRNGSSFANMQETDFVAGAPDDPYGFKPTDLVVDRDGSLLISDWADGQRPMRGRGRIYRITYSGVKHSRAHTENLSGKLPFPELLKLLNSDSYSARVRAQEAIERLGADGVALLKHAVEKDDVGPLGRLHAVWVIAHTGGHTAIEHLFGLAAADPDARCRAQAVRAIADLSDPVLTKHRLEAGRGDKDVCRRLARLAEGADARVRLEVLIALGRLHWSDGPQWLRRHPNEADPALAHAAMLLLRRADNWPAVLTLLDDKDKNKDVKPNVRTLALRALANYANETIVQNLIARLEIEAAPQRRRQYLDLLARVYKRSAEWTYWGFRPAPRPANSLSWEYTEQIGAVLAGALRDPDSGVRAFTARRMLREAVPIPLASLANWLKHEANAESVTAILEALRDRAPSEVREMLEGIVGNQSHSNDNRLAALAEFVAHLDAESEQRLLDICERLEEGPVLVTVLHELGNRPTVDATPLLLSRLDSRNADIRTAAIESLVSRPVPALAPRIMRLLKDADVRVRCAAVILAGKLKVQEAADLLLKYTADAELRLRSASLRSLNDLRDPRALRSAVTALDFPVCQAAALSYLAQHGDLTYREAVATTARQSRSIDVLTAAVNTLAAWQNGLGPKSPDWIALEQTIARTQSASGIPLQWRIVGPVTSATSAALLKQAIATDLSDFSWLGSAHWVRTIVTPTNVAVDLPAAEIKKMESVWLATTDLLTHKRDDVEFLASAGGSLKVWLNGREVFNKKKSTGSRPKSDRFDATLAEGSNRLLVRVAANQDDARFQLRFRRRSSKSEHERLTQKSLESSGNIARGRELFMDAEKSQCIKCHRIGEGGGQVGPDLAGIGSRFSRIHLIESILEPSRTVAPSYETFVVALENGRALTGIRVSETDDVLTLGDSEGKIHEVAKSDIEEMQMQSQSTMPDGLEKRLTERDFVDLIGFLVSQKKAQPQ